MTKWRIQWNVDNVLDWKVPEAFEKYAPYGMSGFDKEGSPSNFRIILLFTSRFFLF